MDRGNATREQLRDALKRQHERHEKRRLESLSCTEKLPGSSRTKKESGSELFTMRFDKGPRDDLRRISGSMGISQADVMRIAFAEFSKRYP